MNFAKTPTSNTDGDEYYLTAHQIFECCGTSTVRVDTLLDKFAPFIKTNKAEFNFLKTLLDPEQCNPEIDVSKLAIALHQYKEGERKMDLDESFNLRCGQVPQDSDSGISTDGLQMLEELQCELREKEHLAQQLRSQLDYTDRQNEETVAALAAERDSLKKHLNVLREENASLSHVRREYEECCERLVGSGAALEEARRELDVLRRRCDRSHDQRAALTAEKQSLQELLSKSKDECHRINEMYAARQSAILEQNENLKHENAELTAKNQDQEEFMTQLIKEKAILEMELKDLLNKSNQTHLRFDRSIDVSYTDDQMLTTLDSLNADSRFCSVQSSESTQADLPCSACENRVATRRGIRRFLWEPLKCLFQVFAVVCFLGAISILYSVSQRGRVRCDRARDPTPWRWFDAQDLMDLLLRIEYTAEVPM